MIEEHIKRQILQHIKLEYPNEACGIVTIEAGKERFHSCTNLAENPLEDFMMNPKDYYRISKKGDIKYIVHSHPNGTPTPSVLDHAACDVMGEDWLIVSYPNIHWKELKSKNKKPDLIGRQFMYGLLDCFTLVEDYYREACDIILKVPQWNKDNGYEWDFWEKGKNYYVENYEVNGFKRIEDGSLKLHDAILMNIRAPISNHCAIYIGDNKILHHLVSRLSCREMYGQHYRQFTTHVLRHEKYC